MISFFAALPTECPFCNGYYRANYSRLSALRAMPRTRVGFRSWRFCVVLKADNLVQNNTPADAEANLDSSDYVFIDLRKADDYKAGHIKGAIAADMDACKGGDFQNGVDTMKAALKDATGSENGADSSCSSATPASPMPRLVPTCFPPSARTWTTCSPSRAA